VRLIDQALQWRKMLFWFWRVTLPVYYRRVQHDWEVGDPLEAYSLHERIQSLKRLKYLRRTLVEEMLGRGKKGEIPFETTAKQQARDSFEKLEEIRPAE